MARRYCPFRPALEIGSPALCNKQRPRRSVRRPGWLRHTVLPVGGFKKCYEPIRRPRPDSAPLEKSRGFQFLSALEPSLEAPQKIDAPLEPFFLQLENRPVVNFHKGTEVNQAPLKVGVVFSGGPAAGGHNVLVGLWEGLQMLNPQSELLGFLGGPDGILKNKTKKLNEELINSVRNQGGFYLLGTGRTKIETKEQMAVSLQVVRENHLDGLVIVGRRRLKYQCRAFS